MDLSGVKPSKHFENRIDNPTLTDKFSGLIYKLFFPLFEDHMRSKGRVSPQELEAWKRRYSGPVDLEDSWINYTKEEQKIMKERGFSPQDIHVLREYNRTKGIKR